MYSPPVPRNYFYNIKITKKVVSVSNQSESEESSGRQQGFYQQDGLGDQAEFLNFYLLQFYLLLYKVDYDFLTLQSSR